MKPILTRVSETAYEKLVRFCAEETIESGRRVTHRAVVEKALEEFISTATRKKDAAER